MKKFLLLVITVFFLVAVLSSCHQTQSCPAYNSYKHYQQENAF